MKNQSDLKKPCQIASRVAHALDFRSLIGALIFLTASAAYADRVDIGYFKIDRTEVTVEAFGEFAALGEIMTRAELEGGGFEWGAGWVRRPGWTFRTPYGMPGSKSDPAVHVSWAEARAFCGAAGGRLPSREEWQLAAYTETRVHPPAEFNSGEMYRYPVGTSPDGMNNNRSGHLPVGTTKQGVNGLYDMGGNVWEWLSDRRGDDALTAGGSWWYGPSQTRADAMQWKPASFYAVYIGFRCVYD